MPRSRTPRRHVHVAVVLAAVLVGSIVMTGDAGSVAHAAPVIVAAGDIACPGSPCASHRATARLIGRIGPKAVLALGDNQYDEGSYADYRASYAPTWGKFRGRTFPTPGNHEFGTPGAAGYYRYFGRRAHRNAGGLYSFNIGRWHLISINTGNAAPSDRDISRIGRNLRRDGHRCELAYWHHPRWSSGRSHGSDGRMGELWTVLFRHGVDVVLNGHEHNYERFAPLTPSGQVAPSTGIREFVVGTGGRSLYQTGSAITGSQKRISDRFGVLRMALGGKHYTWRFVAVGGAVLDRGHDGCHR